MAEYTYMQKKINMPETWFLEVAPKNDKLNTYATQMHLEMKKGQITDKNTTRE